MRGVNIMADCSHKGAIDTLVLWCPDCKTALNHMPGCGMGHPVDLVMTDVEVWTTSCSIKEVRPPGMTR